MMRLTLPLLISTSLALGGCSSAAKLLGGGSSAPAPQATQIPVGNQLALPPDLSLAAPGNTVDGYQSNGAAPQIANAAPVVPAARKSASLYGDASPSGAQPGTLDYNLEKYGISKLKPDGTPKTPAEINAELRKAIIAEKRRTNPGYGTIRNIGAIFSDG